MSKSKNSLKNELCVACKGKCWQSKDVVIDVCDYTRKNKSAKKLADKLFKEFLTR